MRSSRFYPFVTFLIFTALFFWKITLSGKYSLLCGEMWATQFYPAYQFCAYEIQNNHTFPLWNPLSFAGKNFLAEPGSAVLYPWNWFVYFGSLRSTLSVDWIHLWILLSFAIGAWGTYRYARHVGLTRRGSVIAGVTFIFAGVMSRAALRRIDVFQGLLCLPVLLLCFSKALRQTSVRRQLKFTLLSGAVWGIAFLASLEAGLCLGAGIALWTLLYVVRPSAAAGRKSVLVLLLLLSIGAFLAAAAQLIPAHHYAKSDSRLVTEANDSQPFQPEQKVDPRSLFALLFPVGESKADSAIYFGILPLLLAVYGLWCNRRLELRRFGLLAILGLLYSFSGFSLAMPLASFPLMRFVREGNEALAIFHLALSILAGAGAESLLCELDAQKRRALRRLFRAGAALAATVGVLLIGLTLLVSSRLGFRAAAWEGYFPWFYYSWLMMLVSVGFLGWRLTQWRHTRILTGLTLFIILVDLSSFNTTGILRRSTAAGISNHYPRAMYQSPELMQFVWTLKEEGRWDDHGLVFPPNFNLIHRVRATLAQSVTRPQEYMDLYLKDGHMLDLMNVRYQFTRDRQGAVILAERNALLPRFQLSRNLQVLGDRRFTDWLESRDFQTGAVVLDSLEREKLPDEAILLSRQKGQVQGTVRVLWENNRRIELEVKNEVPAFLVTSERYDAGWYAYAEKRDTAVVRCNSILRGIWVPAGEHRVSFRYLPVGFLQGVSLSTLYWLAVVAALLLFRRKA